MARAPATGDRGEVCGLGGRRGLCGARLPQIAVNLVSAATILSLLGVRAARDWWLIAAAMWVYGLEVVLIDPAEDALLAQIFSDAFRRRINGRRLAIQETGRLVAPELGAGARHILSSNSLRQVTIAGAGVMAGSAVGDSL